MTGTTAMHTMVLFGASGDLTQRKLLPALFRLHRAGRLPAAFRLIGYARSALDADAFRRQAAAALTEFADPHTPEEAAPFLQSLSYVRGGYADAEGMRRLAAEIDCGDCTPPIYYLALPPEAAREVIDAFAAGLLPSARARILMEKPFGTDSASAKALNARLATCFDESRIHRIDHYLAKDTVRNLLIFRFANILFEPVWNRHYVDQIQVSATETIGVENRGGYYDGVGAVRDMLQNHVLLLLAFATMEPPLADDPESVRSRVADLLRSIDPPARRDFLFGQYEGYRDAKGVAPQSATPTFAAVRLGIHNWRWHGVPVYLLSGKCLDRRVSEVTFVFKNIPVQLLEDGAYSRMRPNVLTLRIHPDEGIRLSLGVKAPGFRDKVTPAALDFRYADMPLEAGETLFTGYERVLLEALSGRPGLSWRADAIESAWEIVEPLLTEESRGAPPHQYAPDSTGAALADSLLARDGREWYSPQF